MRWLLVSLVALAALAIVLPAGVLAHARYDHSTPSAGQVVGTSPSVVDIFTAQDMRKTAGADEITVTGPDNERVDTGNSVVDDANRRHLSVGLKPNLPPGRYVVSFKTLSDEDGEADLGQFAFYVGAPPTNDQKAADAKLALSTATEDQASPSRTGLYIAVAVIGAVIILAIIGGLTWIRRRKPAG